MLSLVCWLSTLATVLSTCYDGAGKFTVAQWPICHQASPDITVYSGLGGDFLKLGVHIRNHSNGWSAIGFAGNGGMKGASQIVVRMQGGVWVAEDRFSLDYVTPTLDPEQDAQLIFASDNGLDTSWAVLLAADSCDVNDYKVVNKSRTFIWALGASHEFVQHAIRGQFQANLVGGLPPPVSQAGSTAFDLLMPNVTLTAGETNPYVCGIFDLRLLIPGRNLSDIVHVSKFSPKLGVGAKFAHHMILFTCKSENLTHGQVIHNCESMPSGCTDFRWVWAVGSQDVEFPSDVGMPIGEGNFFVAIQMHYYNPSLLPAAMDNSGVTLTIPPVNRAINAGLFTLNGGTDPTMRASLTAGTPRFTLQPQFHVPSGCSQSWQSPITMLGVFHHMHLVGVRQQIEVARSGVSLGLLRTERVYDFRHQSLEESEIATLMPGDQFKITCEYDTSGKGSATIFGEKTDNEMCWSAFMYYPAQLVSGALFQPLPPTDQLDLRAAYCKLPAANASLFVTNVSACTEAWFNDPVAFKVGSPIGYNATLICNLLPQYNLDAFNTFRQFFPNMCPSCWQNYSCTETELETWGQTNVCQSMCNEEFSLSVYPDTSRTTTVYPTQDAACGTGDVFFTPNWPPLPTCVPSAALNSTAAVSIITALSASAPAGCPDSLIKSLLETCNATDFIVPCGTQCQNVSDMLDSAFTGMSATANQRVNCAHAYNSNFAPNMNGGGAWTDLSKLDARLRAGSACRFTVSPAPSTSPWPLVSFVLLVACLWRF